MIHVCSSLGTVEAFPIPFAPASSYSVVHTSVHLILHPAGRSPLFVNKTCFRHYIAPLKRQRPRQPHEHKGMNTSPCYRRNIDPFVSEALACFQIQPATSLITTPRRRHHQKIYPPTFVLVTKRHPFCASGTLKTVPITVTLKDPQNRSESSFLEYFRGAWALFEDLEKIACTCLLGGVRITHLYWSHGALLTGTWCVRISFLQAV